MSEDQAIRAEVESILSSNPRAVLREGNAHARRVLHGGESAWHAAHRAKCAAMNAIYSAFSAVVSFAYEKKIRDSGRLHDQLRASTADSTEAESDRTLDGSERYAYDLRPISAEIERTLSRQKHDPASTIGEAFSATVFFARENKASDPKHLHALLDESFWHVMGSIDDEHAEHADADDIMIVDPHEFRRFMRPETDRALAHGLKRENWLRSIQTEGWFLGNDVYHGKDGEQASYVALCEQFKCIFAILADEEERCHRHLMVGLRKLMPIPRPIGLPIRVARQTTGIFADLFGFGAGRSFEVQMSTEKESRIIIVREDYVPS